MTLDAHACDGCPTPDRCKYEGDCRATWDSNTRRRTFDTERERAELRPCPVPDCNAPAGQPCRNVITGDPLTRQPAHVARLHPTEQEASR